METCHQAEYNFIRAAGFSLTDIEDYYLGGTTNEDCTYENYNDYIPNDSGQWNFYFQKLRKHVCFDIQ